VNYLFSLEHSNIFDLWSRITAGYLDECGAVSLFERVVKDYVDFSCRAEAGLRLRNVEAREGLQNVALRTNLKKKLISVFFLFVYMLWNLLSHLPLV